MSDMICEKKKTIAFLFVTRSPSPLTFLFILFYTLNFEEGHNGLDL